MKLLLDSHTLIWALEDNPRLSRRAADMLEAPENERLVSAASAYEICLKYRLGKLPGSTRLAENFAGTIAQLDCLALAVTIEHATVAANLDLHHRDPFDRLLIAQSLIENAPIVSNEQVFDRFGVQRIW